ncbi:hypothetical protein ABE24_25065 [Cytobacillus firmus]|nr:hypothetical protein [Cytobacillus firmus]
MLFLIFVQIKNHLLNRKRGYEAMEYRPDTPLPYAGIHARSGSKGLKAFALISACKQAPPAD